MIIPSQMTSFNNYMARKARKEREEMKKLKELDREACMAIRKKVEQVLGLTMVDFGLKVKTGRGTFDPNSFSMKVTMTLESFDPGKESFELYGEMFGLKPDAHGWEFDFQGDTYKLEEINPQRPKYPFSARRKSDGKSFKFGEQVIKLIIKQDEAAR